MQGQDQRQIKILNAETARKIAAGEVIDRPNAIVRELLDNAVDSGANQIDVEISGGGIDKVRVADNGCGMSRENLLMAAHPHATSKISSETDLLNLSTLGFRGEALASIAAVSRLTIQSGNYRMRCSVTQDHEIEESSPVEGTIVTSENLFENFPARRQFLKRPASETKMCRSTFLEKALPRPDIAFRLSVDGQIRNDFIAGQSLVQRFSAVLEESQKSEFFYEIKQKADNKSWSFTLIIGDPSVSRADRKDIYIYVNGRRIQEYSLLQAIEYGAQGYFPNGTHPAAALFVQIRPDLVDFNIHPAKREARFKDIGPLHHGVSATLRDFFRMLTARTMKENFPQENFSEANSTESHFSGLIGLAGLTGKTGAPRLNEYGGYSSYREHIYGSAQTKTYAPRINERASFSRVADMAGTAAVSSIADLADTAAPPSFRYIGNALGTFIIVEKGEAIYIMDQHACHERVLFDKIIASQGKERQRLLLPEEFETESREDDAYLESIIGSLDTLGFSFERTGECRWRLCSQNSLWKGGIEELKRLLFSKRVQPDEIVRKVAAMTACKAAVKDGYALAPSTAEEIAREAFELPDPHCPHGRPCWTVISREQLFGLVKRT